MSRNPGCGTFASIKHWLSSNLWEFLFFPDTHVGFAVPGYETPEALIQVKFRVVGQSSCYFLLFSVFSDKDTQTHSKGLLAAAPAQGSHYTCEEYHQGGNL